MPRRFSRSYHSLALWVLVACLLFGVRYYFAGDALPSTPHLAEGVYAVERVVDGDTLIVVPNLRVRLQGVDSPESVKPNHAIEPFGREAADFTRRFVHEADGRVELTFSTERIDRYGRYLAFVWNKDRMLNEELVQSGLARARTDYRYSVRMKRRLAAAEQQAKSARVGIWSTEITP